MSEELQGENPQIYYVQTPKEQISNNDVWGCNEYYVSNGSSDLECGTDITIKLGCDYKNIL